MSLLGQMYLNKNNVARCGGLRPCNYILILEKGMVMSENNAFNLHKEPVKGFDCVTGNRLASQNPEGDLLLTKDNIKVEEQKREINRLQAENKEIKEGLRQLILATRWIPVSEGLPELFNIPHPHSKDVWVITIDKMPMKGFYDKDKGWCCSDGYPIEIIYWMLITLPEEGK